MKKIAFLGILVAALLAFSQTTRAAELITNGGFETGNFAGWTAINAASAWRLWAVSPSGAGGDDGSGYTPVPTASIVQEGTRSAWHGVACGAGQSFTLTQDVTLPAGQVAILRWKDRYQLNYTQFCSTNCGTGTYAVEVLNTSNTLLQTLYTVTTQTNTNSNTGYVTHQQNLSAFGGQTIRLRFRTTLSQSLMGPGQLEVDAVSLQAFPPTSAGVLVGGRAVNFSGAGISGATITLVGPDGKPRTTTTSSLGYYQFDGVEAGNNYVMTAQAKGKAFVDSPVVITVNDNITDQDFHSAM